MQQETNSQGPLWEVFTQKKSGQPYIHVGGLHAFDKEMALENARDLYTRRDKPTGLWVVPASEIVAVNPEMPRRFLIHRTTRFIVIPLFTTFQKQ